MKYDAVFWDIDGTLYDNTRNYPKNEQNILSKNKILENLPDQKLKF